MSLRPTLSGLSFPQLSADDNSILTAPFTAEEIKSVIFNSDGNKSPGPDGFNFLFFKSCWGIIHRDVIAFVNEFHHNAQLPKAITSSFLALIPKIKNPQMLSEFRPISLISSLYKIISKLLASRLKPFLGNLISKFQSAFIPNRQILDGVLVVNEIVDSAKRGKDSCLLLKIDFEKAFDSVSWDYLASIMNLMGFCPVWMSWIKACIFTTSVSVLVNGSPTSEFLTSKGLRQGDPLAPFLYIIAAEGLTRMFQMAESLNLYHGFKPSPSTSFPILQFADDTILLCKGSWDDLWAIKSILRGFELVSGLKVNFHKSCIMGINLPQSFIDAASSFLYCEKGTIPFKFLGLPVGANPRRVATWKPVLDNLRSKLSPWKSRHISLGGRLTLVSSVLSSIPLYFLSFFKIPTKVISDIVQIQRNFLWGGNPDMRKICWVSWDKICLPKKHGGLNVKNLKLFNQSLLLKWVWRCLQDHDAIWYRLLNHKYGNLYDCLVSPSPPQLSNQTNLSIWWRDLSSLQVNTSQNLAEVFFRKLGSGDSSRFWWDNWGGSFILKDKFPRLFSISCDTFATVSSLGGWIGGVWEWRWQWRRPLFQWELLLVAALEDLILPFCPRLGVLDSWAWVPGNDCGFSVKQAYAWLQSFELLSPMVPDCEPKLFERIWVSSIPHKVKVFVWRLMLSKLPTRVALNRRGIIPDDQSLACPFCLSHQENLSHLFFLCSEASKIWNAVFSWLGINSVIHYDPAINFLHLGAFLSGKNSKSFKHLIWSASVWSIWLNRNRIVFQGEIFDLHRILTQIKLLSWSWSILKIGKELNFDFNSWLTDPIHCLLNL